VRRRQREYGGSESISSRTSSCYFWFVSGNLFGHLEPMCRSTPRFPIPWCALTGPRGGAYRAVIAGTFLPVG